MLVIGVVGYPASGKGEFSKIAREMGIPIVVMGDVIRKELENAGLKQTDRNMGEMSRCLRQGLGMDALAKLSIPLIEGHKSKVVLVDGIRGDAEVETFANRFKNFKLIAVESSFDTRLERLKERGRSDDTLDVDGLLARDNRENGWGLGNAMEMADCIITNEGTIEEFGEKTRELLKKLETGKDVS
jgi:dephospho-CoA kinase